MVKLSGEKQQYVSFPSTSFEKETDKNESFPVISPPKACFFP